MTSRLEVSAAVEELNAAVNTRGWALDNLAVTQQMADEAWRRLNTAAQAGNMVDFGLARLQIIFWEWRIIEARRLVAWWDAHPDVHTRPDLRTALHASCNCGRWQDREPARTKDEIYRQIMPGTVALEAKGRALWNARWTGLGRCPTCLSGGMPHNHEDLLGDRRTAPASNPEQEPSH